MSKAIVRSSTSHSALLAASLAAVTPEDPQCDSPGHRPATASERIWTIYRIVRRSDGRIYVGVTCRALPVRLATHDGLARRTSKKCRANGLIAAIRQAHAQGLSFDQAFTAEVLAQTRNPHRARILERAWIARLGTAVPGGFNLMPGGRSLGGPANAKPVTLDHPTRGRLCYPSLMEAVADINRERESNGHPPLPLGVVYVRRDLGWCLAEALGLRPHRDERRSRTPFRWHGRTYHTLHDLVRAEGLPIATARSRLHRARRAGCRAEHDSALDRRRAGAWRRDGTPHGRQPPLALPHPTDPEAAPIDAASFARLTGLPKATVLHRWQRLRETAGDLTALSRTELLARLHQRQERRIMIMLTPPRGPALQGGVREVIRQVLDTPELEQTRPERLGASAIRARLRRTPGWPAHVAPDAVAWAFGFCPRQAVSLSTG